MADYSVPCSRCGVTHQVWELEPSYRQPDPIFEVPEEEWDDRVRAGRDACAIRSADHSQRRYFLRVLIPVEIHGESREYCWGVWVEISEDAMRFVRERWNDPDQASAPPVDGVLVNALKGYTGTVGLRGKLRLKDTTRIPEFTLDETSDHPFVREVLNGVTPERQLEWFWIHH